MAAEQCEAIQRIIFRNGNVARANEAFLSLEFIAEVFDGHLTHDRLRLVAAT